MKRLCLLWLIVLPMIVSSQKWLTEIPFDMPTVQVPVFKTDTFNVLAFGAKSGGVFSNTFAINKTIDVCSANGGGVVLVPRGLWLTGPVVLKSNVNFCVADGALLLFSTDLEEYPLVETSYEGSKAIRTLSPISGMDLENIAITGKGVIDGSGGAWRNVKKSKMTEGQWNNLIESGGVLNEKKDRWYPDESSLLWEDNSVRAKYNTIEACKDMKRALRPVMISLVKCKKVLLDGPTFQNSPAWNIHPLMCEHITVRNIDVRNPWYSQNGDGIDLESCRYGRVENCRFDVGDDAICIKSGKDKQGRDRGIPTEYIIVNNCIVYHGHGGFVIGSEMSGSVRNMYVSNCTFIGTDVGLRFKSTRGRGGIVENIYVRNIDMIDIPTEAIRFNLYYSGKAPILDSDEEPAETVTEEVVPPVTEETPQFRNMYFSDINCKGANQAIMMRGLPEMSVKNLNIQRSSFISKKGVVIIDAEQIVLKDVEIICNQTPVVTIYNSKDIKLDGINYKDGVDLFAKVNGRLSKKIQISNTNLTKAKKDIDTGAEVSKDAIKK